MSLQQIDAVALLCTKLYIDYSRQLYLLIMFILFFCRTSTYISSRVQVCLHNDRLLHKICWFLSDQGQKCIISFKMHQDICLQVQLLILLYIILSFSYMSTTDSLSFIKFILIVEQFQIDNNTQVYKHYILYIYREREIERMY